MKNIISYIVYKMPRNVKPKLKRNYRVRKPRTKAMAAVMRSPVITTSNAARDSVASFGRFSMKNDDPFPQYCFKKMVYSGVSPVFVQSVTNTFGNAYTFKLNSIYDPYVGVTGDFNKGTYGLTEMTALYNRYKVLGVLIEVDFWDPSTDYLVCGINLLNPANYNGGSPSATSTITSNLTGTIARRPQGWTSAIVNTGEQKKTFKQYLPMNQVFNVTKIQYDADITNTTSAINNDPATLAAMEIAIADLASTNTLQSVRAGVRITYFTQFYERKVYAST